MRRPAAVLLLAAAAAGCDLPAHDFSLAGRVELSPLLRDRAPRANAALFVVARNEGGVPVALHRIVNPAFPAAFKMGRDDLLVPSVRRRERLTLHAELNGRGDVGSPQPGDLMGTAPGAAFPGETGLKVLLDRVR